MAAGWVKSLHCKSKAFDDVISPSTSCRNTLQGLKDVMDTSMPKPKPPKPDPFTHHTRHRHHHHDHLPPLSSASVSKRFSKPKPHTIPPPSERVRRTLSAPVSKGSDPFFPSLSDLPEGHPSRNVVEIIFHTRWGPKPFPGRVEMVFKIQNMPKTVTRFDEYRESVKNRAGSVREDGSKYEDSVRCVADGNEMMRFHCLGPTSGVINDAGGICGINGGKGATSIGTYSGSGAAHDSAGGGKGRRAMLVCRVIAGRVTKRVGLDPFNESRVGFDSVSVENGELLVFDSRAVLPCFLVIYKL